MTRVATTRPGPNLTPKMMQIDGQLDQRRGDVEQEEIEHHVDALGAALDDLGERAGAPLEMEAQRQRVDVAEDVLGQPPRRVLADPLEDGVAQIVEQHAAEARAGISDDQGDGEPDRRAPCPPTSGRSPPCRRSGMIERDALGDEAPAARRRRPAPSAPARRPATDRAGSGAAPPSPDASRPRPSPAR